MILDLLLHNNFNGFDLLTESNDLVMTNDLETMILLSILGGDDWWGNELFVEESQRYRSKTIDILLNDALTSSSRVKIEESVKDDLSYLKEHLNVRDINVKVTLPRDNVVFIDIVIDINRVTIELNRSTEIINYSIRKM